MSRLVTIAISEAAATRAEELARRTDRRIEDMLADWIDRSVIDPPVETLADEQIRLLYEGEMNDAQQEELGDLLERQCEGSLHGAGKGRLRQLMDTYRHGLVRKAQALQVAVSRGLVPPLS